MEGIFWAGFFLTTTAAAYALIRGIDEIRRGRQLAAARAQFFRVVQMRDRMDSKPWRGIGGI
jgi:hypothetical protein